MTLRHCRRCDPLPDLFNELLATLLVCSSFLSLSDLWLWKDSFVSLRLMGTTALMRNKLRIDAEKKTKYIRSWFSLFPENWQLLSWWKNSFSKNPKTHYCNPTAHQRTRPIPKPLVTCPQFFKVRALSAARRTAKNGFPTTVGLTRLLIEYNRSYSSQETFLLSVSTEHTAYFSYHETHYKCTFSHQKTPHSRIGSRQSTSILASDGDSPNFVWQATITAAHPDSNTCKLTTCSKNEEVIWALFYLFNSSQATAATMRVPN
jgi:hypothetical protein